MKNLKLLGYVAVFFIVAVTLHFINHHDISAVEHKVYLWKDIVFWLILFEHIILSIVTYRRAHINNLNCGEMFLKMIGFWLIGISIPVILSLLGN